MNKSKKILITSTVLILAMFLFKNIIQIIVPFYIVKKGNKYCEYKSSSIENKLTSPVVIFQNFKCNQIDNNLKINKIKFDIGVNTQVKIFNIEVENPSVQIKKIEDITVNVNLLRRILKVDPFSFDFLYKNQYSNKTSIQNIDFNLKNMILDINSKSVFYKDEKNPLITNINLDYSKKPKIIVNNILLKDNSLLVILNGYYDFDEKNYINSDIDLNFFINDGVVVEKYVKRYIKNFIMINYGKEDNILNKINIYKNNKERIIDTSTEKILLAIRKNQPESYPRKTKESLFLNFKIKRGVISLNNLTSNDMISIVENISNQEKEKATTLIKDKAINFGKSLKNKFLK